MDFFEPLQATNWISGEVVKWLGACDARIGGATNAGAGMSNYGIRNRRITLALPVVSYAEDSDASCEQLVLTRTLGRLLGQLHQAEILEGFPRCGFRRILFRRDLADGWKVSESLRGN